MGSRWILASLNLALAVATWSCQKASDNPNVDQQLDSLLWVLRLVDSGRGCAYIERYLVPDGLSCEDVQVGVATRPVLVSGSGDRLDPKTFRPWYSIGPADFDEDYDSEGRFYVERNSGMAFRMEDGRLRDFWPTRAPKTSHIIGATHQKAVVKGRDDSQPRGDQAADRDCSGSFALRS